MNIRQKEFCEIVWSFTPKSLFRFHLHWVGFSSLDLYSSPLLPRPHTLVITPRILCGEAAWPRSF